MDLSDPTVVSKAADPTREELLAELRARDEEIDRLIKENELLTSALGGPRQRSRLQSLAMLANLLEPARIERRIDIRMIHRILAGEVPGFGRLLDEHRKASR